MYGRSGKSGSPNAVNVYAVKDWYRSSHGQNRALNETAMGMRQAVQDALHAQARSMQNLESSVMDMQSALQAGCERAIADCVGSLVDTVNARVDQLQVQSSAGARQGRMIGRSGDEQRVVAASRQEVIRQPTSAGAFFCVFVLSNLMKVPVGPRDALASLVNQKRYEEVGS